LLLSVAVPAITDPPILQVAVSPTPTEAISCLGKGGLLCD
jgi:hypothetical protein